MAIYNLLIGLVLISFDVISCLRAQDLIQPGHYRLLLYERRCFQVHFHDAVQHETRQN